MFIFRKIPLFILTILLSTILLSTFLFSHFMKERNIENSPIPSQNTKKVIKVGSKNFTEQLLLSKMTSILLKEKGYQVEEIFNMESFNIRKALEKGNIDLYWEYTGTGLIAYHQLVTPFAPSSSYQKVKEIDQKRGFIWLTPGQFNNSFVLLIRKETQKKWNIQTLSELFLFLEKHPNQYRIASYPEFLQRKDGYEGLKNHYHTPLNQILISINEGLIYQSLQDGQIDVGVGFSTDPRIEEYQLFPLKDDRSFFPPYIAAPVIREEVLKQTPDIEEFLKKISAKLNQETITQLNRKIIIEHQEITEVARDWLLSNQFIQP